MALKHMTDLERLRRRLVRSASGCLEYTGSLDGHGYGNFQIGSRKTRRRSVKPHRFMWAALRGEIPDGLCVCHRCDNRRCCDIEHLVLGTHHENTQDMLGKRRHYHGERHHLAKLSETDVAAIRSAQESQHKLARIYGVSRSAIQHIRAGRSWRHVEGA